MAPQNGTTEGLSLETLNPKLLEAEYAVRGAIAIKSQDYQRRLKDGDPSLPFTKVYQCNIGNPQVLGQKPVTFFRQVLSLVDYPQLLDHELAGQIFPPDALSRAQEYLDNIPGGTGAYSESKGAAICRAHVAAGIQERDGHPCNPDDLWLTDGASPAVHYMMTALIRDEGDAILCPIPQYPLYSATIKLKGGTLLPYFLDETKGWSTTLDHLQQQVDTARAEGKCVRAMAVINPGNPTGQVLELANQEELLRFCKKESLVMIADEVYQTNIYAEGKQFYSFKKVLREMETEVSEGVALVSMNSISKGFFGECGRRGGYFECVNFPQGVKDQLYKLASISLCPNLSGQVCMALMMQPPREGDPSYPLYAEERDSILASLKRRAELVVETLNGLEGVSCNPSEGALYAFPRITLPDGCLAEAAKAGKAPDFVYCMALLDRTGIVTVPGSGFGQEPGTFHLRTTILPPEKDMAAVAQQLQDFHSAFIAENAEIKGAAPEPSNVSAGAPA